ncbi:GPI ethanolamine phosphate transferase 1 [Halyomorpha halys]|uniref:GPI ethanolamine phosphate transferase 1 n=1 Tax=Halyomorpha halys TaxID=286706 RepID=UPI0006D5191B|nr:GPI ethanolamine phosphate transferase 1 [Halyomorpha halys]
MGLLTIIFGLHFFFLVSVFDIYFRSPIIEEYIKPVRNNLITETKRLVLFVGDGLPAEHLFDFSYGYSKAPFLRSVVENKGAWGVSHTRVPTESRPGHVALIAGLYEDPSAVFRGWKENPVLFDSVFNRSMITFSWGSPDIVPMFSKGPKAEHINYFTYSSGMEDMSGKNHSASHLDSWVLDNFKQFIQYNMSSYNIKEKSKVIFFFHLLGTDVAGHANKPYTLEYENTIKNMDRVVKELYLTIEQLFNDNHTTYLFTSDHGMTNWGSHGAGSKIETETPIIAWGAGIKEPLISNLSEGLTPDHWKLTHLFRNDINQADIAVLMSILLGVPIPVHSVGTLPLNFLNLSAQDRAKAYVLNAKQLISQLIAKEYQVKSQLADRFFCPFPDTINSNYEEVIYNIEKAMNSSDFSTAENFTHYLITSSLAGLDYYHTYFQSFLLACTVLSFLGLGAIIIAEVMLSYSSFGVTESEQKLSDMMKYVLNMTSLFLISSYLALLLANAMPRRFIIYIVLPFSLWYWALFKYSWILSHLDVFRRPIIIRILLYILGLKLLVLSFYQRWVLSLTLLGLCIWPEIDYNLLDTPRKYKLIWCLSCMGLSIFPLLPIVGGEEQLFFKIFTGCAWILVEYMLFQSPAFKYFGLSINVVSITQLCFTPLLLWNIHIITASFKNGEGLPLVNQCISYFLLVLYLGLMYYGPKKVISRFNTLSYSVGLIFLMFSSSYEAMFPLLLAANLLCWILFERMIKHSSYSMSEIIGDVELSTPCNDFRRSFFFVFYIILSFFGIGNLASLNSFDMTWIRSFITLFSPFLMMSLMIVKVLLPFILVTSAFRFVCFITNANSKSLFMIVLLLCDSMAVQFLFNVKNKGSWLEIGTSISHFIIMKSIVLFLFILFYCTKYITTQRIYSCSDFDNLFRKWHDD